MITVKNVHKSFGLQTLLDDANLQINADDRFALVGPNGAGKSTFFRMLLSEEWPDSGEIQFKRGVTVGYLPQENAPVSTNLTVLEESLAHLEDPDGRIEAKAKAKMAEKKEIYMNEKVVKSDAEWKKILTPEQYKVLREKGTEGAFTGKLWDNHEKGIYKCAACGLELFSSDTKFESGTGWPSYWAPIASTSVATEADDGFFMKRTEALCPRCGGHLGHVFDDGPKPTGLRYCINSAALEFEKK